MNTDQAEEKRFSLKDELFNKNKVVYLGKLLTAADPNFDSAAFVKRTMKGFLALELKQRIVKITEALEKHLDSDFRAATDHIIRALPPPLDPTKTDDDFGDFIFAPFGEYVVRNGLAKKNVRRSLKTIKAITQRFSMEDAIRAFINTFSDDTLAELTKWSADSNYHVRRLVSEGTRPILPWSKRLDIDQLTPLPLLDTLHADATRYVTRSVANHLNDISKSDSKAVLQRLKNWKQKGLQAPEELAWMSRHALRTLVKKGDSAALQFLGYRPKPKIEVNSFSLRQQAIRPGEAFEMDITLTASRTEALMIDYVVDFVKAGDKRSSKVHKLKQVTVASGQTITLSKRHPLRANATTYRLYPGTHHVTLQINGAPFGTQSFDLLMH